MNDLNCNGAITYGVDSAGDGWTTLVCLERDTDAVPRRVDGERLLTAVHPAVTSNPARARLA
jgi:hypothetical protein